MQELLDFCWERGKGRGGFGRGGDVKKGDEVCEFPPGRTEVCGERGELISMRWEKQHVLRGDQIAEAGEVVDYVSNLAEVGFGNAPEVFGARVGCMKGIDGKDAEVPALGWATGIRPCQQTPR